MASKTSKERSLELWAYDTADICSFNGLSEIREINNKWFRGEDISNKDRARYYRAKAILMSTLADLADNLEEAFYFLSRSNNCCNFGMDYIVSLYNLD